MDPLSASRTGFSETGIMGSCHPNAIEGGNKTTETKHVWQFWVVLDLKQKIEHYLGLERKFSWETSDMTKKCPSEIVWDGLSGSHAKWSTRSCFGQWCLCTDANLVWWQATRNLESNKQHLNHAGHWQIISCSELLLVDNCYSILFIIHFMYILSFWCWFSVHNHRDHSLKSGLYTNLDFMWHHVMFAYRCSVGVWLKPGWLDVAAQRTWGFLPFQLGGADGPGWSAKLDTQPTRSRGAVWSCCTAFGMKREQQSASLRLGLAITFSSFGRNMAYMLS